MTNAPWPPPSPTEARATVTGHDTRPWCMRHGAMSFQSFATFAEAEAAVLGWHADRPRSPFRAPGLRHGPSRYL